MTLLFHCLPFIIVIISWANVPKTFVCTISIWLWKDGTSHHPPLPKVFKFLEMLNIALSLYFWAHTTSLSHTRNVVCYLHALFCWDSLSLPLSLFEFQNFVCHHVDSHSLSLSLSLAHFYYLTHILCFTHSLPLSQISHSFLFLSHMYMKFSSRLVHFGSSVFIQFPVTSQSGLCH